MTESTLIQTTENNNTTGVKMEPPPVSPSPSEQQYSLKWNDFQSSILSSFRHLRDEEDFVDVTLACDTRSFTAHKVVLSACSPYFRKLLKANPCEHPIVILRDVRAEDVESLLRFMYNGEVNIGHEQISDFLKTAQLLQVRGLADVTGPQSRTSNSTVNSTLTKTPAVQEHKPSPTSTSLPWDLPDDRSNHLTPPPQKRIKSVDLYRAQHGISPSDLELCKDTDIQPIPAHHRQRNRNSDRSRDTSRDLSRSRERSRESTRERERDRSGDMRESLLGQALEGGPTLIVPSKQSHPDLATLQAQSTGEDSNSSDTAASDRGDMDHDELNGSMDHPRHSFPSFLNLQGIPGLLPGPSGMHGADSFDVQQSCAAIKKEVEYSPSSSGSLSSGTSVALESGPGNGLLMHHHQQQQQQHQHQQQQIAQANLLLARSMAASTLAELSDMKSSAPAGYLLPCPLCEVPLEPRVFRQHLDRHYPRDSPVCPVLQCGRRFAHPNSVRNHMRIKHTIQWAKMKAMRSSGGPFTGMPDFK